MLLYPGTSGEPDVLDADGLKPGVEKAGVERKLDEAELELFDPGQPWGTPAGERKRLKSSSELRANGVGTGLFAAEMCGLGVAESRVGCKVRAGGRNEEDGDGAYDEERLCLCLKFGR